MLITTNNLLTDSRQIYAQICSHQFNDPNERKKRAYISRILLENREAALSYDRDVEVKDLDGITRINKAQVGGRN